MSDPAEVETWGVVGLLHDFDYERFPTEQDHVWRGMEILRERGWPEPVIRAVGAHAFYTGIERTTPMEKAILAADELSGFVGACALVRPSKRVADVPVESVVKRMKDKAFARSVDRGYITRGAEEWGTPLPELVALVLAGAGRHRGAARTRRRPGGGAPGRAGAPGARRRVYALPGAGARGWPSSLGALVLPARAYLG